jgi:hypothetical protein
MARRSISVAASTSATMNPFGAQLTAKLRAFIDFISPRLFPRR